MSFLRELSDEARQRYEEILADPARRKHDLNHDGERYQLSRAERERYETGEWLTPPTEAEPKRRGRPRSCPHPETFWVTDSKLSRPYCRMCNSERMARRRAEARAASK